METIIASKNMIHLDLSWARLYPKDLCELSVALSESAWSLRNLNLSYNKLDFSKEKNINERDLKYSE